jgi:hypothetical protein
LPNLQQNLTGDSTEHYYIPFVRDSQNFVNAAMIITATPTDTSFSYRVDCDYRQLANSTTSVHDDAEYLAIFFMFMDKRVFGYHKFAIKDSNLFKENGNKATKIELTAAAANSTNGNLWEYVEFCQDVYLSSTNCNLSIPNCPLHTTYSTFTYCWGEWIETGSGGGGGTTTTGGGGSGGSPIPPSSCQGGGGTGGGWTYIPSDEDPIIDVISSPHAPVYPDISDNEPQVSLQSLFNCFTQIPNAGATFSIKLCVDLPVNGVWNAPFNLTGKSPGHTFLTLTKTNGTQTISQSVGFYPMVTGINPLNPTAPGGFKNNGDPNHEYNAGINAYNVSEAQFSMVMNNLLSHENDTYNIFNNNCTTIAINAFNLIITPPINVEPFNVQLPTNPTSIPCYFMQSPQKLYKAIESFQPGFGLYKEFSVTYDSPLSTNICP